MESMDEVRGTGRLKHSPYILWAKQHHDIDYNLAASGVAAPSPETLELAMDDLGLDGDHEEGWVPLRSALAGRYGVGDDNIVLTQGASMSNHLAFSLLLEPRDHVLVETPYYEPLHLLPRLFHADIDFVPRRGEHDFRFDWNELQSKLRPATKMVVLSNLHNPTGARLHPDDLARLDSLARDRGLFILVDEVYLEWLRGADSAGERASLADSPLIATSSLTKAYGLDAIRLGWIVASSELAEKMRRLIDLYSVKLSHSSERVGLKAFERSGRLLELALPRLARNLELVGDFIAANDRLSLRPPAAGPVAWVRCQGIDENRLHQELARRSTAVAPGSFFGSDEHFRLGFGMETETLQSGLERLDEALRAARL